jgi:hypothetical protein
MIPVSHLRLQRLQNTTGATLDNSIDIIKTMNLIQPFHRKNDFIIDGNTSPNNTRIPCLRDYSNFFPTAIF